MDRRLIELIPQFNILFVRFVKFEKLRNALRSKCSRRVAEHTDGNIFFSTDGDLATVLVDISTMIYQFTLAVFFV